MAQTTTFADVLEAAEQLDSVAQAELVAIISRRLADSGRERIAASVKEARAEFAAGGCKPTTPADLLDVE